MNLTKIEWKSRTTWLGILTILGGIVEGCFAGGDVFTGDIDWSAMLNKVAIGAGMIFLRAATKGASV